jgi:putative tryptophan/tyrosine transport system substrate-binding protein
VIGVLHPQSPGPYEPMLSALRQGLMEAGFVEGRNILIEQRWAHGQLGRLPELAVELVRLQVAAIVVSGGAPPALAAKAATSTIPIVVATWCAANASPNERSWATRTSGRSSTNDEQVTL